MPCTSQQFCNIASLSLYIYIYVYKYVYQLKLHTFYWGLYWDIGKAHANFCQACTFLEPCTRWACKPKCFMSNLPRIRCCGVNVIIHITNTRVPLWLLCILTLMTPEHLLCNTISWKLSNYKVIETSSHWLFSFHPWKYWRLSNGKPSCNMMTFQLLQSLYMKNDIIPLRMWQDYDSIILKCMSQLAT